MAFGEAPTTVMWRPDKDRETGEQKGWKLIGPSFLLDVGRVTVTKRDGSTQQVIVGRVSREFDGGGGVMCRFGWEAKSNEEAQRALDAQAARSLQAPQEAPEPAPEPAPEQTPPSPEAWANLMRDWMPPNTEI